MIRSLARLAVVAMLLLGVVVNAAAAAPRVSAASWSGDVLILEFDMPMLDATETASPNISLDPPFACRWHWSNDKELWCEPVDQDIRPSAATRYTVSVNPPLRSQQGAEIERQLITADTTRPELSIRMPAWPDGQPLIEISSEAPVTVETLRSHLAVTLEDGSPLSYSIAEKLPILEYAHPWHRAPQQWRLSFPSVAATDSIIALRVKPGLQSSEGPLTGIQDDVLLRVRANESFRLRRAGCSREFSLIGAAQRGGDSLIKLDCPAGADLAFEFSDPLTTASLRTLKARLPHDAEFVSASSIPGYVENFLGCDEQIDERSGYFVILRAKKAGRIAALEFPELVSTRNGLKNSSRTRVRIDVGDFRAAIHINPSRMVLPLNVDLPKMITSVNQAKLYVHATELGGGASTYSRRELPIAARNIFAQQSPPINSSDLQRSGGFAEGAAEGYDAAGASTAVENFFLARAAFNVTVSDAGEQMLVWVTDWNDAGPIANANVEILSSEKNDTQTMLTRGTTDVAGVAMLSMPSEDNRGHEHILVRVTRDGRRAVIPLSDSLSVAPDWEKENRRDNAVYDGADLRWGVTDRPRYRPGDTVQYRVWLRQRVGNRLIVESPAKALKFNLASIGHEKVIAFDATPDHYGSISGKLQLPATLADDTYCINDNDALSEQLSPACFRVAGDHINDLWTAIKADRDLALEGETINVEATVAHASSGPAANMQIRFESLLMPLQLNDEYPLFKEYRFIDSYAGTAGGRGETFPLTTFKPAISDVNGHAKISVTLANPGTIDSLDKTHYAPIPFGMLQLLAFISTHASDRFDSAPATLRFSRYPRFVGLKVTPGVSGADNESQIDAVVITAQGERVNDANITLTIEETKPDHAASGAASSVLAHCDFPLTDGHACVFKPTHAGLYRLSATSANAAPSTLEQYAFADKSAIKETNVDHLELSAINPSVVAGDSAELILRQPFAKARALITVVHGRVLKYWIQQLEGNVSRVRVPIDASWAPGVTISATILDSSAPAFGPRAHPWRLLKQVDTDIRVEVPTKPAPVSIALNRDTANPGEAIGITVTSQTDHRLQLTVAVVDDAVRALVPDLAAATDPQGRYWLGTLGTWKVPAWYGLGDWARSPADTKKEFFSNYALAYIVRPDLSWPIKGTEFNAAANFHPGSPADHSLGMPPAWSPTKGAARQQFSPTAAWQPDIELEPHAARTLQVHLPDNVTRWRVLVWSADETDGFALAQSTLTAKP